MTERAIDGLGDLARAAQDHGELPVNAWDPPYCGDIGMKICADGRWLYQGSPINRLRMVKLFSRILRRDPDGRYYLVTPVEKVGISVEDAPFLAVEMDVAGSGRDQVLTFRTNVEDVVVIDRDHPLFFRVEAATGGLKPYIRVRGRLNALVTRALYYDLVELAEDVSDWKLDESFMASRPDCVSRQAFKAAVEERVPGVWSQNIWFALTPYECDE